MYTPTIGTKQNVVKKCILRFRKTNYNIQIHSIGYYKPKWQTE